MGAFEMEGKWKMRNAEPSDHGRIISVLPDWWGGRDLRAMVPKLFLVHFWDTSFIIEREDELIGFLVAFLSPAIHNEACIHFVGVHPGFRKNGLAKALYERFFGLGQEKGRTIVRACTSPINKGSIAFHERMGFLIEPGDGVIDGIPVTLDYNRPGDHKVLFTKHL